MRIGEVIAASTTQLTAQVLTGTGKALTMPKAPPFGAFVRVALEESELDVFGVVFHAETTSVDAAHRPLALNLSRQELREQQPQIFGLLRTDFSVVVTGYREAGRYRPHLPPEPPMVHDFVYPATPDEVEALTQRLDWLRSVLQLTGAPTDELVGACLARAHAIRGHDRAFLLEAGRVLAGLLKNDYDRLRAILGRLDGG